jgi:hypothetical protein
MLKYSISTRLTISVTRCRIFLARATRLTTRAARAKKTLEYRVVHIVTIWYARRVTRQTPK